MRSRERMSTLGPGAVSAPELLTIVLGMGAHGAGFTLDTVSNVLREFSQSDAQALRRIRSAGPNKGFAFIPGEESFLNVREPWIEINGILLDPDHEFWKSRPECDVARLHAEVVAHEQIHYDLFRQGIQAGYTPGWLESLVVYGTGEEVRAVIGSALQDFNTALMNSADNSHTSPRFTNPHCDVELPTNKRNPPVPPRDRVN
jgi:hypothetical protein